MARIALRVALFRLDPGRIDDATHFSASLAWNFASSSGDVVQTSPPLVS
jgi:hypothetical protein